jgi:hypothetical protein
MAQRPVHFWYEMALPCVTAFAARPQCILAIYFTRLLLRYG